MTSLLPSTLFHILLSIFTFAVLAIAGLLALLFAIQDRLVRYKKMNHFTEKLPSLQTLEMLLLQGVTLGFILLTIVLVTSFYFYYSEWHKTIVLSKMILTLLAWMILLVLLIGRYLQGWRGRRIVYSTSIGFFLLGIAYFFSNMG